MTLVGQAPPSAPVLIQILVTVCAIIDYQLVQSSDHQSASKKPQSLLARMVNPLTNNCHPRPQILAAEHLNIKRSVIFHPKRQKHRYNFPMRFHQNQN